MEDEDDAVSSPLPTPVAMTAAAAAQSQANGRIATTTQPVTVAAPPQHTLTLALPIQQPRLMGPGGGGGGGGGGGREDCWSEGATSTLIDAWGERYLELSRGNLKQKHWQDVADNVSAREDYTKPHKTDVQCKNRIDTLKKKYKLEKGKITSGAGHSMWPFFHRLDLLIGPNHHDKPTPQPLNPPPLHRSKAVNNSNKLPVGIPVGVRSFHYFQPKQNHKKKKKNQNQRSPSVSSKSVPLSPNSSDSFPPETVNGKKRRLGRNHPPPLLTIQKRTRGVEGLRELTRAILKFGEVYERVESSKLQQVLETEKQRMGFAKELELQRMQFFVKTQMELTQLKHHGRLGGNNNSGNNNSNNTG